MRLALFTILFSLILVGCNNEEYVVFQGETMGTYYKITFQNTKNVKKLEIDKIFKKFNQSLSTYDRGSVISTFNRSKSGIAIPKSDTFFFPVFKMAQKYHKLTNGAYDPTVYPLVEYWGFGPRGKNSENFKGNKKHIEKILKHVGMDQVGAELKEDGYAYVWKDNPESKLDFSSIAKGYAIDVVASYLENQGITNYLVDVGGEARAIGFNPQKQAWSLGINTPREGEDANKLETTVYLENSSIATSGNYRNYYVANGKKLSHTINPITGYPERSNLLSATVITKNCMEADAIATALMVLGVDKGKKFLKENPSAQALLIYDGDGKGELEQYKTLGFNK